MSIKESIQHQSQGLMETLKLSPPLGVLGSEALGANLQTWILWGTALYTLLLVVHKVFQIWKDVHKFRHKLPDTTNYGEP
jgi:fumarate reductase subunit D